MILLASLIMKNNFFTETNFTLDHVLFQFSLKKYLHKVMILGIFASYKERCHLYFFNQLHSFYHISRDILVDAKNTIKNICCNFLVPASFEKI